MLFKSAMIFEGTNFIEYWEQNNCTDFLHFILHFLNKYINRQKVNMPMLSMKAENKYLDRSKNEH